MSKVALAREGHGHAELIAGLDDLLVFDRASGLNDVLDAPVFSFFDGVSKRKEGVGDEDRLAHLEIFLLEAWTREKG